MKVLFLDMDGVVNTSRSMSIAKTSHPPENEFFFTVDPECVARLKRVIETTGAQIIVSSSWRYSGLVTVRHALEWGGFPDAPVSGSTPRAYRGGKELRGREIQEWLATNNTYFPPGNKRHVSRYAIVDDDTDLLVEQEPFFVKTFFEAGLQDHHADRLIQLLSDPT